MALPKLTKEFDYQSFDCGIESFNNYLKNTALIDMGSRRQAQVYVLPIDMDKNDSEEDN